MIEIYLLYPVLAWCWRMSRAQYIVEVVAILVSFLSRSFLLPHMLLFDMLLLGVLVYLV